MEQFYVICIPAAVSALSMSSCSMPALLLTLLTHNILGPDKRKSKLTSYSLLCLGGAILALGLLIVLALTLVGLPVLQNDQRYRLSLYSLLIIDGLFVLLFYYRGDRGTRLWLPRSAAVTLAKSVEEVGPGCDVFLSGGLSIFAEFILTIVPIFVAAVSLNKLGYTNSLYAGVGYIFVALLPVIILILANAAGQKISRFQHFREKNKVFFQVASGVLMIILGIYLLILNK